MKQKNHKIRISIADQSKTSTVLESETTSLPKKLYNKLFKKNRVVILAPAESVDEVEIKEKGGEGKECHQ